MRRRPCGVHLLWSPSVLYLPGSLDPLSEYEIGKLRVRMEYSPYLR